MPASRARLASLSMLVAVSACNPVTGPSLGSIEAHRAIWLSKGLTSYTYEYEETGFFISLAGHVIRLEVRQDTVRSAVFLDTGQPVPGSAANLPTVTRLFDEAVSAYNAGSLTAISYDPELGFPTRMDFSGPPDAAGSVLVARVAKLP